MVRKKTWQGRPSLPDSSFPVIYLTVILTTLLIAMIAVRNEDLGKFLASESSPIQIFSVIGYMLAIIYALVQHLKGRISMGPGAAVILLAMALREMDFHDRFTTMGIMKTRFYISSSVPLPEKLIGGAILLGLTGFTLFFIIKHFHPFLAALKKRNRAALLALNGICFTIFSKLIDANSSLIIGGLEESMEMAIPYFFLLAMLLHVQQKSGLQGEGQQAAPY